MKKILVKIIAILLMISTVIYGSNSEIKKEQEIEIGLLEKQEDFYKLGEKYLYGNGVIKNIYKAEEYFIKGAEINNIASIMYLAEKNDDGFDTRKSIYYYIKAANLGEPKAMKAVGDFFRIGLFGYSENPEEANKWYEKAIVIYEQLAKQGNSDAMVCLGEIYMNKDEMDEISKSISWYEKAISLNNLDAIKKLAFWYDCLSNDEIGYREKAINLYTKAINLGDIESMRNISIVYKEWARGTGGKEKEELLKKSNKWLEKRIKSYEDKFYKGDLDSAIKLGEAYNDGNSIYVEKNIEKSIEWYEKAFNKGLVEAAIEIGYIYENEWEENGGYNKSIEWYKKAFDKGYPRGGMELGRVFEEKKDYNKAIEWYGKAFDKGYTDAGEQLGKLYENQKNYKKAIECYQTLIDLGFRIGEIYLGELYEKQKKYDKAIESYKKSEYLDGLKSVYLKTKEYQKIIEIYEEESNKGNRNTMYELAEMYREGTLGKKDYKKAIVWYEKAIKLEDDYSMYKLGEMYEKGEGLTKNSKKALELYKKSAFWFNRSAIKKVYLLEEGIEIY